MKNINIWTIVRTGAAAFALINQVFAISGLEQIPFDEQAVYQWLSMGFTVITFIISWWKNNSFTKQAVFADKVKQTVKEDATLVSRIDKMLAENEVAAKTVARRVA
ncbi:MAG: phage holin [Anaerovorax sp.]